MSHGYAMNFFGVDDSRIQNNKLDGNDHGIQMTAASSRNTIRSNAVSHSGGSAIDMGGEAVAANRIEHNRLRYNGDGIIVGASDTLVSRDLVTGTGFSGFPDTGGFGIILGGAVGTTSLPGNQKLPVASWASIRTSRVERQQLPADQLDGGIRISGDRLSQAWASRKGSPAAVGLPFVSWVSLPG
ncbi:MAG TPA: right-handed parallel beta-helix repeat-containing protein [Actinomycetes bacterium]|jgi:parallel beta-helix repeat protein|nr:right-handed parallel beta-helix repeat-containing protein [Actinomycetes bacterium]